MECFSSGKGRRLVNYVSDDTDMWMVTCLFSDRQSSGCMGKSSRVYSDIGWVCCRAG